MLASPCRILWVLQDPCRKNVETCGALVDFLQKLVGSLQNICRIFVEPTLSELFPKLFRRETLNLSKVTCFTMIINSFPTFLASPTLSELFPNSFRILQQIPTRILQVSKKFLQVLVGFPQNSTRLVKLLWILVLKRQFFVRPLVLKSLILVAQTLS